MHRIESTIRQLAPAAAKSPYDTSMPAPVDNNAVYANLAKNARQHSLRGKTVFITGASRGIGLAIALCAARDGANVVIVAKTTQPQPNLPGTIYTAAEEVKKAGGKALAIPVDIRSEEQVQAAVDLAVKTFGGIDILVNNASAISLTGTAETNMKKYDLMHQINIRVDVHPISHQYATNDMVFDWSHDVQPLSLEERWFAPHTAYTMAKYGMSMCVLGMAGEFRQDGIAVNALWPLTTIATAAVQNLLGGSDMVDASRTAEIMSDAAYEILTSTSKNVTGCFFIDEYVLRAVGVKDFSKYAVVKGTPDSALVKDFFV